MFTSSPGCISENSRSLEFIRQLQIAALREHLNMVLQSLNENREVFKLFIAIKTHHSHVNLFKFFPPQINFQNDSDSLLKTLLFHLRTHDFLKKTFNDQNDTDAKTRKRKRTGERLPSY